MIEGLVLVDHWSNFVVDLWKLPPGVNGLSPFEMLAWLELIYRVSIRGGRAASKYFQVGFLALEFFALFCCFLFFVLAVSVIKLESILQ